MLKRKEVVLNISILDSSEQKFEVAVIFSTIILFACGFYAAISQLPLTTDGSSQLLDLMIEGQFSFPSYRYSVGIFQAFPLLLRNLNRSFQEVVAAYSFGYGLVPGLSLFLSWLVVRKDTQHHKLILWPALGIGFISIWGQYAMISEAIISAKLIWPFVLAICLGKYRTWTWVIAGFCYFLHPTSAFLFFVAAGLIFLNRTGGLNFSKFKGLGFHRDLTLVSALFILAIIRARLISDGYEADQISASKLIGALNFSVLGLPIIGILCTYILSGPMLTLLEKSNSLINKNVKTSFVFLVLILVTTVASWIFKRQFWLQEVQYRFFVIIFSVPLIFFCWNNVRSEKAIGSIESKRVLWPRATLIVVSCLVQAFVTSVQSFDFAEDMNKLRKFSAGTSLTCFEGQDLNRAKVFFKAFNPYYYGGLSVFAQETKDPKYILMSHGQHCSDPDFSTSIKFTSWLDAKIRNEGWLNLQNVGKTSIIDQ